MIRDRSVVFRLSDEEYERVRCAAERYGARSVSEFVRNATLRQADGPGTVENRLEFLEAAVNALAATA